MTTRLVPTLVALGVFGIPAAGADRAPTFERDVQPILTRAGCNAGACHGKARGQNGFALSLLAFDPDFDYHSIASEARGRRLFPADPERSLLLLKPAGCNAGACHGKARGQNGFALSLLAFDPDFDYHSIASEARGRRLFPADPERSLLLLKPAGLVPHGGGKKLPKGSPEYELVRRWIAAGTPRTPKDAPKLVRVAVEPAEIVAAFGQERPLKVTAHFSDGTAEDVTGLALFQSNDSAYAAVTSAGRVKVGTIPGEAAVTARFVDKFAVCNVLVPLPEKADPAAYAKLPRANFIDGHVWDKLRQLNITPSGPATDSTFLRRAYLGVIGRLPTPDETRAFLKDADPAKRARLIDALLERPEYADFWANKWADLLRPNPYHVGIKATLNYDAWIRDQFRKNRPYDQFARELLTAQGSTFKNGATVFYRNRREPDELATMVSQLFLGVRLECAKCHQHPSEKWSQRDFYSFAAFFGRIGRKGVGISAPISGGEEIIYTSESPPTGRRRGGGPVKHPLTGEEMTPTPLLGEPMDIGPDADPREKLVEWMTSKDNPFFARVIANRVWADLMGRGLVDPVDDLRDTNPPSNPALLDALAADFRNNGYDLKTLIRMIATSHVFGLSSAPNERNVGDQRNYSRRYRQRLRAEVLLDAVSDVTGVPEKFDAMPPGTRAMEAWTVRFNSRFLDSFGRPDPNQDPPCERTTDTTVVQALHLMNAPGIAAKITADSGRAARLAAGKMSAAELATELYLLTYCRPPNPDELNACLRHFEKNGANRRAATEDLMWALINTPEFVFGD